MKNEWIIGVDLRSRHEGAVEYAAWWRSGAGSDAVPRFSAVHVKGGMEKASASLLGAYAEERTRRKPPFDRVATVFPGLETAVVEHGRVEEALEAEVRSRGASGLLVGRKARSDEISAIRLGTVARRLARRLCQPLVVVPPDWSRAAVNKGPVLLATDLGEDTVAALGFARAFARSVGRPLVAVHAARDVARHFHYAESDRHLSSLRDKVVEEVCARTETWMGGQGARGCACVAALGDPVERVLAMAKDVDAVLVVCGSRRLAWAERWVQAGVGTSLAAHASCPVAIVPPDVSASFEAER
ncbi:MAG: universal stress protein [Nannocystaceae bacterium]